MSDSIAALSLRQLLLLLSPHEGREVLLGAEVAAMARRGLQPREEALVRVRGEVGVPGGARRKGVAGGVGGGGHGTWRAAAAGGGASQGETGCGNWGLGISVGAW